MWDEQIRERIVGEIHLIDRLFSVYADLLALAQQQEPTLIEKTALASVLHSFYNGIETICLTIAKGIDKDVPTGSRWHRDLLLRMEQATTHRTTVFSASTTTLLGKYLSFRHFYRHAYSFLMHWDEMEELVRTMEMVWLQTRTELHSFLDLQKEHDI